MSNEIHSILPEPTLRRLPWYLAYVEILKTRGERHISSTRIARALNVDSSQIAKDLSFLNLRGKTRIGYEVTTLAEKLTEALGFRVAHRAYVLGVGSLGSALMSDSGLSNYGLQIVAGFDTDPEVIGRGDLAVPVYHIDDIEEVMAANPADICILTVPAEAAQDAADAAIAAGMKAIWNFTPYRVKVAEDVVMSNTSIYAHLALIYNRLNVKE